MPKIVIKVFAIVVGVSICGIVLLFALTWTSKPKVELNVDSVEWLPSSASNISYVERTGMGGMKIAEFSISRADMDAFAKENGWDLKEKENVSISFRDRIAPEGTKVEHPYEENYLEKALFYEKRHSNNGGVTLVYDPKTNRGYYWYSHR